ncbi:MAG: hypothetical protein QOE93_2179, partial [Actinomycetota bacterium]|nr:hypothetical protein [Actinomycetota bacterium]
DELGGDAFLDSADIDAGEPIGAGVVEALLGARVVVVFVGQSYFTRWYCLRELGVALASFNALVERGAGRSERSAALEPVVVAVSPGQTGDLDWLPPLLRGTNWPAANETATLAALVRSRLAVVADTLGERLGALGQLASVRLTVLEETEVPPPRSLVGVPRFALPGELRISINDAFVGRADELWRIHHELSTLRADVPTLGLTGALEGGGGFGKTRLATEYFHRFGPPSYPGGLFWVNAELGDRLEEQLHGILSTLVAGTPSLVVMRETGRDIAGELADALHVRTSGPVLYVVDNVPEPGPGESPEPLTTWCPAMGEVALLVTSRAHQSVTAGVRSFRVEALTPDAAVAMLTRDYPAQPRLAPDAWERIAEWVGHLPLALELLNAALREGVLEAEALIAMAENESPLGPLDASAKALTTAVPGGQLRGITEALAVSYAKLSAPARAGARLLAQLAPAPIPVAILEALGSPTSDGGIRATLISRSFLIRPAEGTAIPVFGTMHRVLADFLRAQAPEEASEIEAVCHALLSLMTLEACGDPRQWSLLNACLPHAEAVFARVRRGARSAIGAGVTLGSAIGVLLAAQGLGVRAREVDEAVLALSTATFGEDHTHTLVAANNLAETLRSQGDIAAAKTLHERVLEAHRRLRGPEHSDTLTSTSNLAATLFDLNDAAGARALLEEVYRIQGRILGDEDLETLRTAHNVAEARRFDGDRFAARDLFKEVVDVRSRILGAEHPETLASSVALAATLFDLGEAADARTMLENALEAQRRVLGPHHPDTTRCAWNLFAVLSQAFDWQDVIRLVERDLFWLLSADPDELDRTQRRAREELARMFRRSET